jgi:hypothetical protein
VTSLQIVVASGHCLSTLKEELHMTPKKSRPRRFAVRLTLASALGATAMIGANLEACSGSDDSGVVANGDSGVDATGDDRRRGHHRRQPRASSVARRAIAIAARVIVIACVATRIVIPASSIAAGAIAIGCFVMPIACFVIAIAKKAISYAEPYLEPISRFELRSICRTYARVSV